MPKPRSPRLAVFGSALMLLAGAAWARADAQSAPAARASAPAEAVHSARKSGTPARKAMDLHAPPLNQIYSRSELRYILAADDSGAEAGADSAAEVSVKSTRATVRVPGVPGNQLQAVPWAILHPTQAWRIFTPLVEP